MEDNLTLEELYLLMDGNQKVTHREHQFLAAIQGVDLDAGNSDEEFERIKRKAEADLAGVSEEEFVFDMIGIEIESDDD